MSHGKKKWIEAYDGKLKRSNDRTKKDYYRDLKWWDDYRYYRWRKFESYRAKNNQFCPQCKHVQKPILAEEAAWKARNDELHAEYNKLYESALNEWTQYGHRWWQHYRTVWYTDRAGIRRYKEVLNIIPPKTKEPPHFWDWLKKYHPNDTFSTRWNYDVRSYLCFKCENKYDKKHEMWDSAYPGKKRNYTWTRRQEYRNYRNEVRTVMQRAKYDEEYYDDIPKYKRGWLD